jgi:hypothetical protein
MDEYRNQHLLRRGMRSKKRVLVFAELFKELGALRSLRPVLEGTQAGYSPSCPSFPKLKELTVRGSKYTF